MVEPERQDVREAQNRVVDEGFDYRFRDLAGERIGSLDLPSLCQAVVISPVGPWIIRKMLDPKNLS